MPLGPPHGLHDQRQAGLRERLADEAALAVVAEGGPQGDVDTQRREGQRLAGRRAAEPVVVAAREQRL